MLVSKWNVERKIYENYTLPQGSITYSSDMEEVVSCARCGIKKMYGDCYSSKQIHTDIGFGYAVCENCHKLEIEEELSSKIIGRKWYD